MKVLLEGSWRVLLNTHQRQGAWNRCPITVYERTDMEIFAWVLSPLHLSSQSPSMCYLLIIWISSTSIDKIPFLIQTISIHWDHDCLISSLLISNIKSYHQLASNLWFLTEHGDDHVISCTVDYIQLLPFLLTLNFYYVIIESP